MKHVSVSLVVLGGAFGVGLAGLVGLACGTTNGDAEAARNVDAGAVVTADGSPTDPAVTAHDAGVQDASETIDAGDGAPPSTCPSPTASRRESDYFRPNHAFTKGACTALDVQVLTQIDGGSFPARKPHVGAIALPV
jgi:hypothetical protein